MLKLGSRGLTLIKAFESFVPYLYDDALPMERKPQGGVGYRVWTGGPVHGELTIGYGHTEAAGPPKIAKGMVITMQEAEAMLDQDLDAVEADVNRVIKWPLEQHQFDALCSFHFNCYGLILRSGELSTCAQAINRGDMGLAMRELGRWVHQGPRTLPGLVRRRAAEKALFEGDFEEAERLSNE